MRNRQITASLIFTQNLKSENFFHRDISVFRFRQNPSFKTFLARIDFRAERKKIRSDGRGAHNIENFCKSYSGIFGKLIITKIPHQTWWVTFVQEFSLSKEMENCKYLGEKNPRTWCFFQKSISRWSVDCAHLLCDSSNQLRPGRVPTVFAIKPGGL